MAENILKQLYEGKIYPNENVGLDNPELQKLNAVVAEAKEQFKTSHP
ncbi:MAG: hypothetical protein FWB98_03265 [Defluviitaleaceae bacterium]|nr:hypothetical protein [Defluviitaleaceae bacterium]